MTALDDRAQAIAHELRSASRHAARLADARDQVTSTVGAGRDGGPATSDDPANGTGGDTGGRDSAHPALMSQEVVNSPSRPLLMDQPGKRTPNVARIYDYLLGGKDNYTEDREAANQLLAVVPDAAVAAMDNRQFLGRVVEYLTREAGIRQFIDIGTGLPTRDSVHSVAHRIASDSRVAYVDNDPVVVAHANALLGGQPGVSVIEGDLREPGNIVTNAGFLRMIDFNQPVAVLLVAVLHFIRDSEDPAGIVSRLKSAIAPGSYLVISHVTDDHVSSDAAIRVRGLYEQASAPGVARSRRAVTEFFDGLEMVPPGLVSVTQWRPGRLVSEPGRTIFYAGAGMKC